MNEAGLPVIGSDAASNSEIFNGSITPSGGTGPFTFALTSPATGSHGTLVLNAATGTYTYTLTTPFDTTPDSTTTAAQTEQDKDSFGYTVTDAQGNTATGTILVDIIDDVPTATLDSGNVNEGALLTVAASGVLANDVAGADGFAAGGGVVGVRAAGGDLTTDVTTGVGTDIAGQHGTLHSECRRRLHLSVDGEQHHGGHHRRVRLHGQGRRRRPVDDDADDQSCQRRR